MIGNPLEQFRVIQSEPFFTGATAKFLDQIVIDLKFTNVTMSLMVLLFLIIISYFLLFGFNFKSQEKTLIVPNRYLLFFEAIYEMICDMIESNTGKAGQQYFPFIITLFLFILLANLIGLIPFSYTTTSQLALTLCLSTTVFVAVNIILFQKHGLHAWSLFLPPGTSLPLIPILVPIELVSHSFKVISLAVRLFANMMAGHTLLKVIASFSWTMAVNKWVFLQLIPFIILYLLVGLELAVAMIQAYVFTILTCIYLNEAINLH
jgi:ATP synthase subunit 6